MSSKLHSQIKVGDRVVCIASQTQLASIGVFSDRVNQGSAGEVTYEVDGAEWVDVQFDSGINFSVLIEYLVPEIKKDDVEVEEAVIAQIRKRRDAGRSKYGTTMERTDLSILQWVQHAQEEAMDFSIYLEKLKRVLKEKGIE